ncbi:hypothetical protein JCM8202_000654 [Rhodotorula sphaerocarpa]
MNAHHQKASYRPPPPVNKFRYAAVTVNSDALANSDAQGLARLTRAVERIPFGWQVDAVIPEHASRPQAQRIQQILTDSTTAQLVRNVNLADLLTPEFLSTYIRRGHLVALSLDDGHEADIVAIDGRGRLVLSVTKDTYESLGLAGRASAFGSHRQRYIIELRLNDPSFRAGKPGFERIKRILGAWPARPELLDKLANQSASRAPKRFDLVMTFVAPNGLPQPIEWRSPSDCIPVPQEITSQGLSSIAVPQSSSFPPVPPPSEQNKKRRISSGAFHLTGAPPDEHDPEVFWEGYREWAGLVSLGEGAREHLRWRRESGSGGVEEGEEEEMWALPREKCEEGDVTALSCTGLLHPRSLSRTLEILARSVLLDSLPFLSLSLRPFPHAPLSHISSSPIPVVNTSKKPNGKKRKRGRGRGEEEEADPERNGEEGGWEVVMRRGPKGSLEVHWWEQA